MVDIEAVKQANPIEGVVAEDEELESGRGRFLRGAKHDSLVVDTHRQTYHWNSRNEWGDVIEWLMKHRRLDFRGAVETLCRRAGLELPAWKEQDAQAAVAARARADTLTVAARHWVRRLWETPEALEYCHWRGWSDETIKEAGLGFVDGDVKTLRGELAMHNLELESGAARAVCQAPKGMLVYPCVRGGRVVYFMCRMASKTEKRHWNPPVELVGERQPYFNAEWAALSETVVLVEGQADAITLGQWGMAAVALAGTALSAGLLQALKHHRTLVVGLDLEADRQAAEVANALGPLCRIIRWPAKDANQWLQEGGTADEARGLIDGAPIWALLTAQAAGETQGAERDALLRRCFELLARMDEFATTVHREELAKAMKLTMRQFNVLLRGARGERKEDGGEGGEPGFEIETPGGYVGGNLLEMLVIAPGDETCLQDSAKWRTCFACRFRDGRQAIIPYLDVEGIRYKPMPPGTELLVKRVVSFPSEIGEQRSLRELVRMVQHTIRRYVDVDIFYETLASYYVLFTWLYDSFNTVPYLRLLGDAGTGKSRFIQVVGAMCYRPMITTGAATTSPIFRMLDQYRGTLILDEADYAKSDEAADIVKILNTGYQRMQGVVLRSGDKMHEFETQVYVVYGPKIIATRKRFLDWALESRCLTHEAGGPTARMDIPVDMPMAYWTQEALAVRNLLLRYRLDYWRPEIELDYSSMDVSVEPRLNQVTVALQTMIDDEDLREDVRRFIREYNQQMIVERGMTITSKVLEAICGLWFGDLQAGEGPVLTVKRVAKAVNILIDTENQDENGAEPEEDNEEDEEPQPKGRGRQRMRPGRELRVTPKKVGNVARKELHLRTERDNTLGHAYVIVYEHQRVEALRKRFGIDEEWLRQIMATLRSKMLEQKELEMGSQEG